MCRALPAHLFFFFFNDTATTEIYTLSLHDVFRSHRPWHGREPEVFPHISSDAFPGRDRKSTRLNSSHGSISYAVFCLKKDIEKRGRVRLQTLRLTLPLGKPALSVNWCLGVWL